MKITVKVANRTYAVEVGDIHDRPVIAVIEGEVFEVWPEDVRLTHVPPRAAPPVVSAPGPVGAASTVPVASGDNAKAVRAPIPGVIISVAVEAGDTVRHGQELCVLEAMKMKNVIRASRAGTIDVVCTAAQQHVKHHDVLMEYRDEGMTR
jgi:glutaconyl-CoA/methylmalonyl-CoA decarboxylase subunit gamma